MRFVNLATAIVVFGVGVTSIGVMQAQDYSEPVTYGDYEISAAGQSHQIEIVAGGENDASELGGECYGQIATAPNAQLSFESSGAPLIFEVQSDFDSTLAINTATGDWLCDDDSGDDVNALVEIPNPNSGTYDIWIGAFFDDENYSSATLTISHGAAGATNNVASNAVPTGVDRLERGELAPGDAARGLGEYQDVFDFDGTAGEEVVFDLRSQDFDTYLTVRTPSGEEIINDDYDGDTSRSLLAMTLEESGAYQIAVSSFFSDETGPYSLAISRPMAVANLANIEETGVLSADDPTRPSSGGYVDTYEFDGAPGRQVIIDLTSDDFDTYLVLTSPSGEVQENDDTDSLYHSQIITDLSETGTYRAQVTSFETGETGAYRLSIAQSAAVAAAPGQASRDTVELALGQSVSGELQDSDSEYEPSRFQDLYSFSGSAGQHVRVDLPGDFDTYLVLRGPGGEEFTNDDYDGSYTRSLIDVTLPEAGRYQVVATSYGAETIGNYNLSVGLLVLGTGGHYAQYC